MRDFFTFKKLVLPSIAKGFFWVTSAIAIFIGLLDMALGLLAPTTNPGLFLNGLLLLILGPLFLRAISEFVLVVTRSSADIAEIKAILTHLSKD